MFSIFFNAIHTREYMIFILFVYSKYYCTSATYFFYKCNIENVAYNVINLQSYSLVLGGFFIVCILLQTVQSSGLTLIPIVTEIPLPLQ